MFLLSSFLCCCGRSNGLAKLLPTPRAVECDGLGEEGYVSSEHWDKRNTALNITRLYPTDKYVYMCVDEKTLTFILDAEGGGCCRSGSRFIVERGKRKLYYFKGF